MDCTDVPDKRQCSRSPLSVTDALSFAQVYLSLTFHQRLSRHVYER
jgi:hypothetical protein